MRRQNNQITQFREGPFGGHIERYQRHDPFQHIQQMMMTFGGFHNDPFMNGMLGFGGDPFQEMFNFSNVHKNVANRGTEGAYMFQSFSSSATIGPDGKIKRQEYFENNMGEHRQGNTISQRQQAYKNNSGVNRIAEERMLNDRGRKIVREKVGQNVEETNHYYNIDEEESQKFDADWRQVDSNLKFLQNGSRNIRQMEYQQQRPMQIAYQPANQPVSYPVEPPRVRQTYVEQPRVSRAPEPVFRQTQSRHYQQPRRFQGSNYNVTFNNPPKY